MGHLPGEGQGTGSPAWLRVDLPKLRRGGAGAHLRQEEGEQCGAREAGPLHAPCKLGSGRGPRHGRAFTGDTLLLRLREPLGKRLLNSREEAVEGRLAVGWTRGDGRALSSLETLL